MENKSQTKIRPLVAAGAVALVILLVFLAVQLVQILPWAFGSLASIATSIDSYRPTTELNLSADRSVINSGGEMKLTWYAPRSKGDLKFSYQCHDELEVTVFPANAETAMDCDEAYPVDSTTLAVRMETEGQRFVDVTYQLAFTPENGESVIETGKVTVVNADINGTNEPEEEPKDDTSDTTSTSTTKYRTIEVPYYKIPVSDPNGYTELSVSYVGAGIVRNNLFSRKDSIVADRPSGIRFAVKNLGTKTSEEWTYRAVLPTGYVYRSDEQAPLKPNEESIITLTFTSHESGVFPVSVNIYTDNERSKINNQFNATVRVTH